MARLICKILGVAFIAAGLLGFAAPGMLGMHLSPAHNLIHLISGGLAAWFAWNYETSYQSARNFCISFGGLYLFLGIAGLFAGPAPSTIAGMPASDNMLQLIPGILEFGTVDSVVHTVVGLLFLVGGLTKPTGVPPKGPVKAKEKVGV